MGDVKYNSNVINAKLGAASGMLKTYTEKERSAYETLLADFSISAGDEAASVRQLLEKEKQLVESKNKLYTELINKLLSAQKDLEQVEKDYSGEHVEKK